MQKKIKVFNHLLINSLISSITNFTVWFGITFFAYLETQSVLVTGVISGMFLVATALSGFWLGSIVDHNKKKNSMLVSSFISLFSYSSGFVLYVFSPDQAFKSPNSLVLWIFIPLLLIGVIAGNIRNIALPTIVTMLFPEGKRDKANGLVGTTSGVSFLVTSVISGFLVGWAGMYYVLLLGIIITLLTIIHLFFISIPEKNVFHIDGDPNKGIDIKGTFKVVSKIEGLFPLILFTTFNNFLGGVFMALMDAYGLSLVSVEVWGTLWGVLSTGFIIGGIIISKRGLGKNPLRSMFLANIIIWMVCIFFTIQPWILLLIVGMYIYLSSVPFIEASEHTILQKVVPKERQGRVFGFAQSVEQMASPLTAFFIGPLTQKIFIPFMTTGAGAKLIGSWFGTGPNRGIALVFTLTGMVGLLITLWAKNTKYYILLSKNYISTNKN